MDWLPVVGWSGVALLVVAWLAVSFSQPSPRREVIEWLGACSMYVALLSLFGHLLRRALEQESALGMVAFGFLVVFFGVGLVLCVVQTASSLRGPRTGATSATN